MGGKISQQNLEAQVESGQNDSLNYINISMQGLQIQMQNSSISCINIDLNSKNGNSLFAVFDGIRGFQVSQFVKQIFVSVLTNSQPYIQTNYEQALKQTFEKIDQLIFSQKGERRLKQIRTENNEQAILANESISDFSGCLASVILLTKKKIYSAHIGDSKIYLMRDNNPLPLFKNHQPYQFDEKLRIQKAYGQVIEGRINGNIKISRGFGFGKFKQNKFLQYDQQIITCNPSIQIIDKSDLDKFIFMACDGLWSAHQNFQINLIKKINFLIEQNPNQLDQSFREIINDSIARNSYRQKNAGTKNMTAILIKFNQV